MGRALYIFLKKQIKFCRNEKEAYILHLQLGTMSSDRLQPMAPSSIGWDARFSFLKRVRFPRGYKVYNLFEKMANHKSSEKRIRQTEKGDCIINIMLKQLVMP